MRFFLLSAIVLLAGAGPSAAQTAGAEALVPLNVQIVLTRTRDAKIVQRLPYTIVVNANEHDRVVLNLATEVPVRTGVVKEGAPPASSYRNVGTAIECSARTVQSSFGLALTISHSSIDQGGGGEPASRAGQAADLLVTGATTFRSFKTTFNPVLRDGQTAQYVAATDQVTGEVLKVEVTLNVLK